VSRRDFIAVPLAPWFRGRRGSWTRAENDNGLPWRFWAPVPAPMPLAIWGDVDT